MTVSGSIEDSVYNMTVCLHVYLFFLVFLIIAGTILYMIALTLLVRRKDYQPLKS